jgi:prolyl 4-hydroxylase
MEALQIVKYGPSGHCVNHYDGSKDNPRQSSIFAYIYSNGTGGGTNFPLLERPVEKEWCEFLDCSESAPEGATFKPIIGNALYWENSQPSGEVHPKTLHAGMPVTSGVKIGLNIWTQKKIG